MLISSRSACNLSANSGMVQRGSLDPWSAWWSALFHSPQPMDRALGAAATVALSLAVLRLAGQALNAAKDSIGDQEEGSWPFSIITGLIRSIVFDTSKQLGGDNHEWIAHRGSCHCKAIQFELVAPKKLKASCGQGKIQFPHSRTKATNFRLLKGTDHLHMYYVNVPAKGHGVEPVVAAHSFCCQCGVNILHAPNSLSTELDVNVSCLEKSDVQVIRTKQNTMSGGIPVSGQWQNPHDIKRGDQFEGISEDEDDEFEVQHDTGSIQSMHQRMDDRKRPITPDWPGTPSTIGTSATENTLAASRVKSFGLDHGSVASSDDLDSIILGSNSLGPPMARRLASSSASVTSLASGRSIVSNPARSIMTEATTPILRNQLKQYMSKHLAQSKESILSNPTNINDEHSRIESSE